MAYTSNDMMDSVKLNCNVPTSQITFTADNFYALIDQSIRSKMIPLIIKQYEEFYVFPKDFQITNGVSSYDIPTRAINMALRSVQIVDGSNPDTRVNLERLNIEDLYAGISGNSRFLVQKNGFYIENNQVVLYPSVNQTIQDILRLNYFIRPGQITDTSNCGLIQSIDFTLNQITCTTVPQAFASSGVFDLVKAQPGFDYLGIDQTLTGLSGNVMTFTNALSTKLAVGDWVCPQYQSCIVQVPVELQPLLTQYVVVRVLSSQGDKSNLKDAIAELEKLETNASILLAPRVQGSTKRVVNARAINRWV